MECRKPSDSCFASVLILLVLVMAVEPGIALKLEPTGTSSHIPPLLDCAPSPSAPSSSSNLSAFHANVVSLLGVLPAAAAAAPTGLAAAHSGGDPAFARAFCFGYGVRGGSSASDCLNWLSAAAQDVTNGCHGHRGAVWRAGCFLSYADTNASTAREDAWRGWFYDHDSGDDVLTAAMVRECVANTPAAECSRCLNESAKVVRALKEGWWKRKLSLVHGDAVVVVGYSCYLRVPLFPPTTRWVKYAVFDVVAVMLGIEILGLLFCISMVSEFN